MVRPSALLPNRAWVSHNPCKHLWHCIAFQTNQLIPQSSPPKTQNQKCRQGKDALTSDVQDDLQIKQESEPTIHLAIQTTNQRTSAWKY
jgi:hypothetical protein